MIKMTITSLTSLPHMTTFKVEIQYSTYFHECALLIDQLYEKGYKI